MSEEYDRSFFIKSTDATWMEQLFVRIACILQIPILMVKSLLMKDDLNFITKNKAERMTGKMNCQSSKELNF